MVIDLEGKTRGPGVPRYLATVNLRIGDSIPEYTSGLTDTWMSSPHAGTKYTDLVASLDAQLRIERARAATEQEIAEYTCRFPPKVLTCSPQIALESSVFYQRIASI